MNFIYKVFNKFERHYHAWQRKVLVQRLARCGERFDIDASSFIWCPEFMEVGDDCCLRGNCYVYAAGGVKFGDRVRIAANSVITSVTHQIDNVPAGERRPQDNRPVTLADDVWIAANSVVCAGVSIGRGTVVAAGSVVTSDLPENVLAAGAPAKVIRTLKIPDPS